jgi:hypothetical protein
VGEDVDAYYKRSSIEGPTLPKSLPTSHMAFQEFGLNDVNGVGIVFGQDIRPGEAFGGAPNSRLQRDSVGSRPRR